MNTGTANLTEASDGTKQRQSSRTISYSASTSLHRLDFKKSMQDVRSIINFACVAWRFDKIFIQLQTCLFTITPANATVEKPLMILHGCSTAVVRAVDCTQSYITESALQIRTT